MGFQNPVGCPGNGVAADVSPEETRRRFLSLGMRRQGEGSGRFWGEEAEF